MDIEELLKQGERILSGIGKEKAETVMSEALEFLRDYAGPKSSFYEMLEKISLTKSAAYTDYTDSVKAVMRGFLNYLHAGLYKGTSVKREIQLEVVTDFIEQAQLLLNDNAVHPATPTMIIGASLEEFLRNWVDNEGLTIGNKKPGIDAYATTLREKNLITKQDVKDITSWAGLRNYAAHGEWNFVDNLKRISIMLEGVNLFMRKYMK